MRRIFLTLLAIWPVAQAQAREAASAGEHAAICGTRPTCRIAARLPAGNDPAGSPLTVARVALGLPDKPGDAPDDGCRTSDGAGRDGGEEYWLLRPGSAPRNLLALCNDGYGASGLGEDTVEVGPNLLTHHQYGGSALRWTDQRDIRLEPLAIIRRASCGFRSTGGPGRAEVFDALRFVAWAYADRERAPDEVGCPVSPPVGGPGSAGTLTARALVGPRFPEMAPRLGACALLLSTAEPGLAFGRPAPAAEAAELRAILLDREDGGPTLLIQVTDPLATRPATRQPRSWVDLPHVGLWLGQASDVPESDGRNVAGATQFGILRDGRVERGVGTAFPPPTVTREAVPGRPGTLLLRVVLPRQAVLAGIALAYSQAVEGRQARLVSSAPLERGRPIFLPTMAAARPPCQPVAGALEPAPWLPAD